MKAPLNILHLEDDPNDAEMAGAMLAAAGIQCAINCVKTREDFEAALKAPGLDLVISDFSMPGFNGVSALKISRQQRPEVPFIFLSGTIGEELAVEALKQGAIDYVLKDRLSRLTSSVQRAVHEAAESAERRRMEDQIREQATLLDQARDAICVKDMAQQILYWNKGAERMYGWTAREALGGNANELLFQDDLAGPVEALRSLIRHGEWRGELHQVTRDKKKIIVESRWTLLRDPHGQPKSILVINTDITEKRQIEGQLLRTQRMESIGALAGGIAHDLNNALTPVMIGVDILRRELVSPQGVQVLDLIAGSARRSSDMVRQILSFSRGVGGPQALVSLKQLVAEILRLTAKTFPLSVKVIAEIPDGLHGVVGNSTQLHQVLLNLCVNARDAMPRGGFLRIEAANVVLASSQIPEGRGLHPGHYVSLSVSDTGSGIAPELLGKIFEPFFTTKEPGHGTGLGLSTVTGIVKTHGGFLDVASEVGRGTTFKIYLPAMISAAAA